MLGWIPLLGPILQGLAGLITPFANEKIAKIQADTQTTLAETQASVQILQMTNDDLCLRIIRDLMVLPGAAWLAIGGWDSIVAHHWPWLKFGIASFPPQLAYYPYAVLVFLLGNIGLNTWKRL